MNYNKIKNETVNLDILGGNRDFSIEELVQEVIYHRRTRFFNELMELEEGETNSLKVFDAIAFKAAIADFTRNFDYNPKHQNFEGCVEYTVTAGSDWVWECKTTITWKSTFPVAFGTFLYQTEVLSTQNVEERKINAMSGTLLKIKMNRKNLKVVTIEDTLQREIELGNLKNN